MTENERSQLIVIFDQATAAIRGGHDAQWAWLMAQILQLPMRLLPAVQWALLQGREYVTPEDVKSIGPDVLRHRLILTYEAEAQAVTTDAIIKKIFNAVPVP